MSEASQQPSTTKKPASTGPGEGTKRLQGIVMLVLFLSSGFFYKVAIQTQDNYNSHVTSIKVVTPPSPKDSNGTNNGSTMTIKTATTTKSEKKNHVGVAHVEEKKSIRERNDLANTVSTNMFDET